MLMSQTPNVLLVILDSARVQNMGVYGYDRDTTPFLSDFVDSATFYEQARAPGIHSIASHVSMFTGYHVEEHKAKHHGSEIDVEQTIWKELAKHHGYTTGLFTPNHIIATASNLSDAFDHVKKAEYKKKKYSRDQKLFTDAYGPRDTNIRLSVSGNFKHALADDKPVHSLANCVWEAINKIEDNIRRTPDHRTTPGDTFIDAFLEWGQKQTEPWAACINLLDTHSPYVPEDRFNKWGSESQLDIQDGKTISTGELLSGDRSWDELESLESLYDGTILQADQYLKQLVNGLRDDCQYDDTLLIITSDHGEAFGEESNINPEVRLAGHNYGIHEVLTHVPLVVKYPGQQSGESISELATLTNIPDTVREVIQDSSSTDQFTKDEYILSSTFRILRENTTKFPYINNINKYVGPWRSIYTSQEGATQKYADHNNTSVVLDVSSPFTQSFINGGSSINVDKYYENLSSCDGLREGDTRELNEELEEHLKDLGYIR